MLDDQTFIYETELKKVLNLTARCDPFILMPTLDPEFELKKTALVRIISAERIIVQEILNSNRDLT